MESLFIQVASGLSGHSLKQVGEGFCRAETAILQANKTIVCMSRRRDYYDLNTY